MRAELIREYVVEDPNFKGGKVVKNFGNSFPSEAAALKEKNSLTNLLMTAESLCIDAEDRLESIRHYEKLEERPDTFLSSFKRILNSFLIK